MISLLYIVHCIVNINFHVLIKLIVSISVQNSIEISRTFEYYQSFHIQKQYTKLNWNYPHLMNRVEPLNLNT